MTLLPAFESFPSIPRIFRTMTVMEKIDGTNAQVHVAEDGTVTAGSRNRWITPEADNFGFAAWVAAHAEELRSLGAGAHYGEWWGSGIQRRYGLTGDDKRFSLFNAGRWGVGGKDADKKPACCHVVPVLAAGVPFDTNGVMEWATELQTKGSLAAPGFMDPEGVVVWHEQARQLFKFTLDDDGHKGAR